MTPVHFHRRHRTSARLLPLALVGALALTACGDDTVDDGSAETVPASVPAESLDGRTYLSTATSGFDLVPGTVARLSFTDGQVGLQAGCNSMGSPFSVDGATLVVDAISSTEMGCDAALMAQDQLLAELLGSKPILRLDGDVLVMETPERSITFLDREVADPDRPLEQTSWTLTGVLEGDTASSVPAGAVATLSISDGTALVNTGCNTGSAPVTVEGDTLVFGPLALTKKACEPALMELESVVASVLSGTATFTIEAATLTLRNGDAGLTFGVVAL